VCSVLIPDERTVVHLLYQGYTVTDLARHWGYANHTPVSKKLAAIRAKVDRSWLR
jgi:hypothetical protein